MEPSSFALMFTMFADIFFKQAFRSSGSFFRLDSTNYELHFFCSEVECLLRIERWFENCNIILRTIKNVSIFLHFISVPFSFALLCRRAVLTFHCLLIIAEISIFGTG